MKLRTVKRFMERYSEKHPDSAVGYLVSQPDTNKTKIAIILFLMDNSKNEKELKLHVKEIESILKEKINEENVISN